MWRGERRGIDNGPAVRQQGREGLCVCVRHGRGGVKGRGGGYKQEAERPGAVWFSSGRLWGCVCVYIYIYTHIYIYMCIYI